MIFSFRFLLAFVGLAAVEALLEPEAPQRADSALAIFSLSVALFLSTYAIVFLLDLAGRRVGGRVAFSIAMFVQLRHLLPLVYWFALLFFARWDAWVDYRFQDASLTLSSVVLLAPFLAYEALALLGEFLLGGAVLVAGERLRSTLFLAPMLFFLTGAFDLMHGWSVTRAAVAELDVARGLAWVLAFAALFVVLPLWFAQVFGTRPLSPESLREDFEAIAERSGVPLFRIHEWPTRRRSLNALLVGPFRWTRSVFFTDLILARFRREQLRAVFAHEIGHVRERHVLRSICFFLVLPLLLGHAGEQAMYAAHREWPELVPMPDEWTWITFVLASLVVLAWPVSRMRRRFEHEADLRGAEVLGEPGAMISALEQLESYMPRAAQRGSLFHPSTRARVAMLERAEDEPQAIAAWRRTTRRMQVGFAVALLAVGAYSLPFALQGFRQDVPGYLLARGEARAAYRAFEEQRDMPGEERARGIDQARRAVLVSYGAEAAPVEELRRRAVARGKRAMRKQDFVAVQGWFALARRLGTEDSFARTVSRYLDARASGDARARVREAYVIRAMEVPAELRRAVARLLEDRPLP